MVADYVTRREALSALGAAGLAGVAGCLGGGGDDGTTTETTTESGDGTTKTTTTAKDVSGTVKIGVLQPTSGPVKYYGKQSLWGFYTGLAHRAGATPLAKENASSGTYSFDVGDVTYELFVRDTKFSKSTAGQQAKNLVTNKDVDMLFGCTSSGSARRVIKSVVKRRENLPMMVGPAASAGITSNSETCSPRVFRASENTAMDARSGGKYVANQTDVSKVYLFGADYSFGHAVVQNYKRVLQDNGVEIVGEKFVQRGHKEWSGLLDNAEEAGAEGIVTGFTVVTLPYIFSSFLQGDYSYRAFGGWATRITVAAMAGVMKKTLGTPLTQEKLDSVKLGPFTTRYHWNQYDNPINDSFVQKYTNAYGIVPDLFTSGTFTAASAIDQAVRASGSTKGSDIANALRGMTVTETPKGENAYTFQGYNNQARSAMTVANPVLTTDQWSDSWPAAVMPGKPVATIPSEETTIPADSSQMGCSL